MLEPRRRQKQVEALADGCRGRYSAGMTITEIIEQAMKLSNHDKLQVVRALQSVVVDEDEDDDPEYLAAIDEAVKEADEGLGLDPDVVFAELRATLEKMRRS
jgi:hypothetical protein